MTRDDKSIDSIEHLNVSSRKVTKGCSTALTYMNPKPLKPSLNTKQLKNRDAQAVNRCLGRLDAHLSRELPGYRHHGAEDQGFGGSGFTWTPYIAYLFRVP